MISVLAITNVKGSLYICASENVVETRKEPLAEKSKLMVSQCIHIEYKSKNSLYHSVFALNTNVFTDNGDCLGQCNVLEHAILTRTAAPISAWKERELIKDEVNKMLKQGVIEPAQSPW
ncbi:hypothetical protein OUZ56_026352 [Daphnia magna]|uniref:Uncharacterized protein n=1 Tax=Daphnia magna TaxID=35525 RepID=A0ABQ9ZLI1_9CRUS|nr:hypothetical protein OUZ56_026352 [Daphnia magna]